ncbi:MAG TPA: hypothetical protein VFO36_02315 [Nitrospiraceae bacterium]|nr:hypothetical protein [Nitrospiraceae bacterium]
MADALSILHRRGAGEQFKREQHRDELRSGSELTHGARALNHDEAVIEWKYAMHEGKNGYYAG